MVEKLTTAATVKANRDCNICGGTGMKKDPTNPKYKIPCHKCNCTKHKVSE